MMQAIGGFTWPGIEWGEPPGYKYSFFEVRRPVLATVSSTDVCDMHTMPACALLIDTRLLMRAVFTQYIDALRLGHLDHFEEIEEDSGDWWFPTMDRGAGAALHFAAEHGQVSFSKVAFCLCSYQH